MTNESGRILLIVALVLVSAVGLWMFLEQRNTWPRGEALLDALDPFIKEENSERAVAAKAIRSSYLETRANAARWSGVYWGCTFLAAIFGAVAGLILKLESLPMDERRRKDVAAILAVGAALLVTLSTSGDFQRKWQANRIAAAELERMGYEFLQKNGTDARSYLGSIGETMHRRHMAIVGGTEQIPAPIQLPVPGSSE